MAQPGKTFKTRIDRIVDPELLETERRAMPNNSAPPRPKRLIS
jgi:hypothetical protein